MPVCQNDKNAPRGFWLSSRQYKMISRTPDHEPSLLEYALIFINWKSLTFGLQMFTDTQTETQSV